MKTFKQLLKEYNACDSALNWLQDRNVEQCIKDIQRGDWTLWLSKKLELPQDKIILAKGLCTNNTVIHLMNEQSINTVKIAILFEQDKATKEELDAAAIAAYNYANLAASSAAYSSTADYANASAFVDAAFSASFSAANSSASDFAAAASNFAAASATNAAADKKQNQKTTANICKEILGDLIISQVNFLLNED